MKTKSILKIVFVASLAVATSCDVKDPIYNTPHPDHGMVTLTTDWSNIGTGLTAPDTYTVTTGTDGYSATLTGATNRLDHLFPSGDYQFRVYNSPAHITLNGNIATVEKAPDGSDNYVNNAPGWLFTGTQDLSVVEDTEQSLTVAMQQHVGELTLFIKPTGNSIGRIEHIEGFLTGVASTLDIATGKHTGPMNVELPFTEVTEGVNAGKWSATVRLLGVVGHQMMSVHISFVGGTPSTVNYDAYLSEEFASFNRDKRTPLVLGGEVVETPTEAGFTSTIINWEKVTGKPGTAD